MRLAHWQSQTKEDINKYINPYYILKVYLLGTLENRSHSYYTEKSKNVKPYTIIIPKILKSARIFCIFLLFLLCRLVYGSQENAKYKSADKGTAKTIFFQTLYALSEVKFIIC